MHHGIISLHFGTAVTKNLCKIITFICCHVHSLSISFPACWYPHHHYQSEENDILKAQKQIEKNVRALLLLRKSSDWNSSRSGQKALLNKYNGCALRWPSFFDNHDDGQTLALAGLFPLLLPYTESLFYKE